MSHDKFIIIFVIPTFIINFRISITLFKTPLGNNGKNCTSNILKCRALRASMLVPDNLDVRCTRFSVEWQSPVEFAASNEAKTVLIHPRAKHV